MSPSAYGNHLLTMLRTAATELGHRITDGAGWLAANVNETEFLEYAGAGYATGGRGGAVDNVISHADEVFPVEATRDDFVNFLKFVRPLLAGVSA